MNPVKSNYFQFNKATIKKKGVSVDMKKKFLPLRRLCHALLRNRGEEEKKVEITLCLITLSTRFKHSFQRQAKEDEH